MSVDLSEQNDASTEASPPQAKPSWRTQLQAGFRELQIVPPLLYGLAAGLLMTFALFDPSSVFALLAGIIPVSAGLLLVRSVRGHYTLHGFVTGVIAALVSLVALAIIIFLTPLGPQLAATGTGGPLLQEWFVRGLLPAFMLLIFCTFGASTSGRMEQRNRALRAEVTARGGQLEKPSVIRNADDIRGLSLPQLGFYVNTLFKKKGFTFKDYRFLDKDKHLDLWMEKDGDPWHLRISVADKISPGTIESLLQEMKRTNSHKGLVITSTEFTPAALKSAKDRPVILIDGPTLYEIAEG